MALKNSSLDISFESVQACFLWFRMIDRQYGNAFSLAS